MKKKVLIMGAAGRDFHDFNTYYRNNENYEVVAFTATQIPWIEGRPYPPELSGKLYPEGIPIHGEKKLEELIKEHSVDEVVFSYSDVSHEYLMHKASQVLALGADFKLLGPKFMQLKSSKPVVSICAVRTGSGKSQTTRRVAEILKSKGKKVAVIRHPMPYGDLAKQAVQRFEKYDDMKKHNCTIEEMEEYELHIEAGTILYAGVDFEAILREAEKEADVILWDGGNNDVSFYKSDLHIVVADPHRVGHESRYHPGETNVRMADVVVINKMNTAEPQNIEKLKENIKKMNSGAKIVEANSPLKVEEPEEIRGKKVLVIEDGPTLTHGEMKYGAAFLAAEQNGVESVIDPRPFAAGTIKETYAKYPHLEKILPAMGYSDQQLKDLEETINKSDADLVLSGTPIDLTKLINPNKKVVRVRYDLEEIGELSLEKVLNGVMGGKQ